MSFALYTCAARHYMIVMTFAIETAYAVDAPGLIALSPSTDVAAELEALERELTSLAGHLNAGNYCFLVLLAEFDRRGGHVGMGIASCASSRREKRFGSRGRSSNSRS
jgi:hypothetical protein